MKVRMRDGGRDEMSEEERDAILVDGEGGAHFGH